jgi:hypothetical protein
MQMSDYEDYLYSLSEDGLRQECRNYVCTKENKWAGRLMLKLFAQKLREHPQTASSAYWNLPTPKQMEVWDNANYEFTHGV